MTIKSVLCVFGGSPEEVQALNASLALAGLDQSSLKIVSMTNPGKPVAGNENKSVDEVDVPVLMAHEMVVALKKKGQCRASDLTAKGFTLEDIAIYWDMARALAAVELAGTGTGEPETLRDTIVSSRRIA